MSVWSTARAWVSISLLGTVFPPVRMVKHTRCDNVSLLGVLPFRIALAGERDRGRHGFLGEAESHQAAQRLRPLLRKSLVASNRPRRSSTERPRAPSPFAHVTLHVTTLQRRRCDGPLLRRTTVSLQTLR